MEPSRFFGFGSLVNQATHIYPAARTATLPGWRRHWVATDVSPHCFLSARPVSGAEIDGLMCDVPGGDWAALDARETNYARHPEQVTTRQGTAQVQEVQAQVQVYAVEDRFNTGDRTATPILLSYLDVVIQGYLREFGADGVARFIASTDGWDAPVLDDRTAPIYPRAQHLAPFETELVNGHLTTLGSRILPLET